jgi:Transposase IS200 like
MFMRDRSPSSFFGSVWAGILARGPARVHLRGLGGGKEIRKGRHVVYLLHTHLVFVTKRRGKVFGAAHLKRLEAIFRSVCTDFEVILKEFNGEWDHVHLLVNYP